MGIASAAARTAIVTGFDLIAPLFYQVNVRGLHNARHAPRVYYAMQHQRDTDPILILPHLLPRLGWEALAADVRFAMRGDAFAPGFLARLVNIPPWSRLLYPLQLGPLLHRLGIYPLVHAHKHAFAEWIWLAWQMEPQARVGAVLAPEWITAIATRTGRKPDEIARLKLAQIRRWRYLSIAPVATGPDMFIGPWRRRVEQAVVTRLKDAISRIAAWLDAGCSLLGSPEAGLSPDGRIAPISAGFQRLMRACEQPITVVPIAINYDYLTTGRSRVFVSLAPPIPDANRIPEKQLGIQLRDAWLRQSVITTTQLGSAFLWQRRRAGDERFAFADALRAIMANARSLLQQGCVVDPHLLAERQARDLVRRFLQQAVRQALLQPAGPDQWTLLPQPDHMALDADEVGYRRYPLHYARNELQEILECFTATKKKDGTT